MNLLSLLEGLKNETIKLNGCGHIFNPIIDDIEMKVGDLKDDIKKLEAKDYSDFKDIEKPESFLDYFKLKLTKNFESRRNVFQIQSYCFCCDNTLFLIPYDEENVYLITAHDYMKISEEKNEKYSYNFVKEDFKKCEAARLVEQRKMVSSINVETGKLIFQNYFDKKELYVNPENEYGRPSINSYLGREALMQYLATQDIGYGQMGNMGMNVYANDHEILILDVDEDSYTDNKRYFKEHPERLKEEDFKDQKEIEKILQYIADNNMEFKGYLSLSVWRWQCADESVMKKHNEELKEDSIVIDVLPGKWEIEHYYDFAKSYEHICSRLQLVK